jgi:hypothetical protein
MSRYEVVFLIEGSDWQVSRTIITADGPLEARRVAEGMFGSNRIKGMYLLS